MAHNGKDLDYQMAIDRMSPRKGWYSKPDWIKAFRPDGIGRIGVGVPGDMAVIEFTEIICDACNADAGTSRLIVGGGDLPDGTIIIDPIYYDGWGSYCVPCGKEAEARGKK